MDRRLGRLITCILLAFGAVAAGLGYWQVAAAPAIVSDPKMNGYRIGQRLREDVRGKIVDRTGQPLADTVRGPDGYDRRYPFPGAFPIAGYWSLRYGAAGLENKYDPALRGRPVVVLVRWNGKGPRNVLVRREDGRLVVRPFRGLRSARKAA